MRVRGPCVLFGAFVRTRSAGPSAGEKPAARFCVLGSAQDLRRESSATEFVARVRRESRRLPPAGKNSRETGGTFYGWTPASATVARNKPLEAQFAAGGVVPFCERCASRRLFRRRRGRLPGCRARAGCWRRWKCVRRASDCRGSGRRRGELRVSGESGGNFPAGREPSERTYHLQSFAFVERGGHFVAHASLHRLRARRIPAGELRLRLRSGCPLSLWRATGIELTEVPPSILPRLKVVRGFVGTVDGGKFHDAAGERGDGIGHAEIGPAMAAGAGDGDFEAARGERCVVM